MAGVSYVTVTIANAAAASGAFNLGAYKIAAVITPAAWTAGDISFEVGDGAGNFRKVIDSAGALLKITGVATGASEYMVVPEAGDLITGKQAKVVSTNTASEADVNQGAARTLQVVLVPL